MNGTTLRDTFNSRLPKARIRELAALLNVVERERKLDLVTLVWALVLTAGSDDSGRLADVFTAYLAEAEDEVVRGSFYGWFTDRLMLLMATLTQEAVAQTRARTPKLEKSLMGVDDWIVVDSETITLRDALASTFPATSTAAGLKVHKHYSLGRGNIVAYEITPARDHDAPRLRLDESWRGLGLIVDLGYASHKLIRDCQRFGVELVIRLKKGWKPRLVRTVVDGEVLDAADETTLENLLQAEADELAGVEADLDVAFGEGSRRIELRLVGVPGKQHYHWCLTTLPRETHPPKHVCNLYRTRWEVELDNGRDKGAARIDQLEVTSFSSAMILVHASLLRSILANDLVASDLAQRPATRPPLHAMAVSLAICSLHHAALHALSSDDEARWEKLARNIRSRGHDPNWRHRPSMLDTLRGTTAPLGRPWRKRLADCPPSAGPFRQQQQAG